MTAVGVSIMAKNYQARPRERLADYLARQYPMKNRDKLLAVDLEVSPRTARNLFENHWPGDETWAAIVRRFGADVLRAVFAPEIDPVLAELSETEARLEREWERLQARKREVAGGRKGLPHPLALGAPEADELSQDLFEREARL